MQDMIIRQTGNSRTLKSVGDFLTRYPTYQDFANALAAGTLPVDFNGLNPEGIAQAGTPLSKANLLSDATAALFGLDGDAVPDDVFGKIAGLCGTAAVIEVGEYTGVGATEANPTLTLTFSCYPELVIIARIPSSRGPYTMNGAWGESAYPLVRTATDNHMVGGYIFYTEWEGKTLRMRNMAWNGEWKSYLNSRGSKYRYVCIGRSHE